jgi:hypothetical protein
MGGGHGRGAADGGGRETGTGATPPVAPLAQRPRSQPLASHKRSAISRGSNDKAQPQRRIHRTHTHTDTETQTQTQTQTQIHRHTRTDTDTDTDTQTHTHTHTDIHTPRQLHTHIVCQRLSRNPLKIPTVGDALHLALQRVVRRCGLHKRPQHDTRRSIFVRTATPSTTVSMKREGEEEEEEGEGEEGEGEGEERRGEERRGGKRQRGRATATPTRRHDTTSSALVQLTLFKWNRGMEEYDESTPSRRRDHSSTARSHSASMSCTSSAGSPACTAARQARVRTRASTHDACIRDMQRDDCVARRRLRSGGSATSRGATSSTVWRLRHRCNTTQKLGDANARHRNSDRRRHTHTHRMRG